MSLTTERNPNHVQNCDCENCITALRYKELMELLQSIFQALVTIAAHTKK